MTSGRDTAALRTCTRGARPIAAVGAACALSVYLLVATTLPLYETRAVLSAQSSALLVEYSSAAIGRPRASGSSASGLSFVTLGDLGGPVRDVRDRLGAAATRSAVGFEVNAAAGELAVIARGNGPRTTRLLANGVAAAIVEQRDSTTAKRLAGMRQQLRLIGTLARRSPRLRQRTAALRQQTIALAQLRRIPGSGVSMLRQASTPTHAVSPRATRDVVLAALVGALLALTLRCVWRAAPARLRRA